MLLLALSYIVNIVVVTVVPALIARDVPAMAQCFGADSGARRILACLYFTIALASLAGLGFLLMQHVALSLRIASVLLPLQIVYKVMTWPVVGWANPVVKSNLAISILHALTLYALVRGGLIVY